MTKRYKYVSKVMHPSKVEDFLNTHAAYVAAESITITPLQLNDPQDVLVTFMLTETFDSMTEEIRAVNKSNGFDPDEYKVYKK